jgi:branched-chain amino acid transport system substrate-binding protein
MMNKARVQFFLAALLLIASSAKAEPKKIGVTLPLSGMASVYGTAFQNGLQLFQEEHPESAAELSFMIDDSAYDGARVVSSVRKLAQVDKVSLVFVWGAMPSDVAAPLSSQIGVPMMVLTFEPKGKDRPALASFDLPFSAYRQIMRDIISRHHIERMGVVGTNIGSALSFLDLVRPDLPKLSYEEIVSNDTLDFSSLVTKIRAKPVDGIFLLLTPQQIGPFVAQAAAQGYRTRMISGDLLADDALREKVKTLMGSVTYMYGGVFGDFKDRYRRRFGNTSNIFEAASAYSFGLVLLKAAPKLGTESSANFVKALPELTIAESPVGAIQFEQSAERGMHAELHAVAYDE